MKHAGKPLKALIVEDNEDDLALLLRTLKQGGYKPAYQCVDNGQALNDALAAESWDIVLTDCHLPVFSGMRAIKAVREFEGLDIPVIVVSGAIGEETAAEMIRAGAQDYVLKDKLSRLPLAIERELSAAKTRSEKRESEQERVLDRENFISIVAHDLRAPVQRIETMVKLLRVDYEDAIDADGKDIVFRIERSAARLRLMLGSLMAYARSGRTATRGRVASLPNTIHEVLDNLGIDQTTADLKLTLGNVNWVKGDAVLIGHVIQNLVSNAFKFRHKDRRFSLHFEAAALPHGKIEVSVTDNGIGIEPRFADKVFEIFYRLHDDDEYEGTGIGLAICKKIVNDHGGSIWVDKDYSGGTRITFALEAADFGGVGAAADSPGTITITRGTPAPIAARDLH